MKIFNKDDIEISEIIDELKDAIEFSGEIMKAGIVFISGDLAKKLLNLIESEEKA